MSLFVPKNCIEHDFLIIKTNVLRNDKLLIDGFYFHDKYESLAYVPYKQKPVNFSKRNPAFELYMHVREALGRFNANNYRNKAQISKGEVLLTIYENEDNDLSIDVLYWNKNNRDYGKIGNWVTMQLVDIDTIEPKEYNYIVRKLTDFWDAYFESDNPYIPYLQEQYLTNL